MSSFDIARLQIVVVPGSGTGPAREPGTAPRCSQPGSVQAGPGITLHPEPPSSRAKSPEPPSDRTAPPLRSLRCSLSMPPGRPWRPGDGRPAGADRAGVLAAWGGALRGIVARAGGGTRARWLPVPTAAHSRRIRSLVAAIPPLCRAETDPAGNTAPPLSEVLL